MNSDDFLIVGAGSVGLFATITAVDHGFRVRVLDGKPGPRPPTYAVPLHPLTLELLDGAGMLGPLAPRACRVNRITIHHGRAARAELDLASLEAPFPFLLTVGLDVLEQALYRTLAARGVEVFWDHRVETITQEFDGVQVEAVRADHTRWTGRASGLLGADGCHSQTRTRTNLGYRKTAPAATYLLLEGEAPAELGHEIRVGWYGTRVSSIWPLAGGRARWNLRLPAGKSSKPTALPTAAVLEALLQDHVPGCIPLPESVDWALIATFERRLVDTPSQGRVWVAGDAAHSSGPSAAHSMNLGFLETADRIAAHRSNRSDPPRNGPPRLIHDNAVSRFFEELSGVKPAYACGASAPLGLSAVLPDVLDALPVSGPHRDALLDRIDLRRL
jgi:2-polyprenyl-6-methoxyphenol hydroxylase-like FAD-dependent oxidoreductase